jgi:plastocyanin
MPGTSFRRGLRIAGALLVAAAAPVLSGCASSGPESRADLVAGKQLFVQKCGACHVLNRAGTKGVTGPNLDEAFHRAKLDGMDDASVRGAVYQQILNPSMPGNEGAGIMPADLVTGDDVNAVAAYVAKVAAEPGEDEGLLANAVPKPGSGEPIAAENGTLTIPADPTGQLAYASAEAEAPAGPLTVVMPNESGVPHNIVIDGKGESDVIEEGETEFEADFEAGTFAYYCSVQGHREAGMEGELTVG